MAKEKKEKKNTFLYILKLPFLGIFYVVDFFIKILNWEIIGIVTFILTSLGVVIGNKFGNKYETKAQIFGALILIVLSFKILLEHLV